MKEQVQIQRLKDSDIDVLFTAFQEIGWNKTTSQYRQYLAEQEQGSCVVFVAWLGGTRFAGYVTLAWRSDYEPLMAEAIPEIQDLNVLPAFQRHGIGSRLLDEAERLASMRCTEVGIGVGLHPGYNAAQRLYAKRGYIPDGQGVTYQNRFITEGDVVVADDELVLHFRKQLHMTG
jgi:GNAT superfamily N-acetyltransferase